MRRKLLVAYMLVSAATAGAYNLGNQDCLDLAAYPGARGWVELPGIVSVAVDGVHAYVTASSPGFTVIDYSDLTKPKTIATLELKGWPWEVTRVGHLVYVAAANPDLYVIDVSDPGRPVIVDRVEFPEESRNLVVDGDRLYLVGGLRLRVFDISPTGNHQLLGETQLRWPGIHFDVDDGIACVAPMGSGTLMILDVHDPAAMREVQLLRPCQGHDVDLEGDLLYVGDRERGLVIYDLADPTHPVQLGSLPRGDNPIPRVQAVGAGRLLLGDWREGLEIIDVGQPASPKLVGRVPSAQWVEAQIAVRGDLVAVPVADHGLQIVDIANLALTEVKDLFHDEQHDLWETLIVGERVFVAGWPTVWSVPVDPTDGTVLTVLDATTSAANLHQSGDRLYVAAKERGIYVLDISQPEAPIQVGHFATGDSADDICSSGDVLFVATSRSHGGLQVLDAADPAHIRRIARLEFPENHANAVAVVGQHLYVGTGSVWVVDVTDPAAPRVETSLLEERGIVDLELAGDYLYASSGGQDGVFSIDVTNPGAPYVCHQVTSPLARGGRMAIAGSLLYIARDLAGVQVVDIANPREMQHLGFLPAAEAQEGVRSISATSDLVVIGDTRGHLTTAIAPCSRLLPAAPDDDSGHPVAAGALPASAPALELRAGPNPANPRTEIQVTLARAQHVRAAVYDSSGRHIVDLADTHLSSGTHHLAWDGLDADGRAVPSGLYLIQARTAQGARSLKVSLVR